MSADEYSPIAVVRSFFQPGIAKDPGASGWQRPFNAAEAFPLDKHILKK
jgi:hypothetical protein